jgi:hypothetical protein
VGRGCGGEVEHVDGVECSLVGLGGGGRGWGEGVDEGLDDLDLGGVGGGGGAVGARRG